MLKYNEVNTNILRNIMFTQLFTLFFTLALMLMFMINDSCDTDQTVHIDTVVNIQVFQNVTELTTIPNMNCTVSYSDSQLLITCPDKASPKTPSDGNGQAGGPYKLSDGRIFGQDL